MFLDHPCLCVSTHATSGPYVRARLLESASNSRGAAAVRDMPDVTPVVCVPYSAASPPERSDVALLNRSDIDEGELDTHLLRDIVGKVGDLIVDVLKKSQGRPTSHLHNGGITVSMEFKRHGSSGT